MEKWFAWIKNHIFMVILIMLFLIIGIPFIIYISFKIPAPIHLLEAGPGWNEGVVLGYYGSILGFFGTVVLSMLALYQNQEIKNEADKRTEILERQIHSPELKLKFTGSFGGDFSNMQFELENISSNLADDIQISEFKVFDKSGNAIEKYNHAILSKNTLIGGEKLSFSFSNSKLEGTNLKLIFSVSCRDKFNNNLQYKATMMIVNAVYSSYQLEFEK